MKLYYSPGACSLAPHIALVEAGLPFTSVKVDLRTHKLADGTDYYTINPKGYVPLLELPDGERLSEVAVILQYIADRKPGTIAPAFGTMARYRLMEWLNFVATEVHKQFSPLFYPTTPEATREAQRAKLATRFDLIAKTLEPHPFLEYLLRHDAALLLFPCRQVALIDMRERTDVLVAAPIARQAKSVQSAERGRIVDPLPAVAFPATLSLEHQGLFALGYYHESRALFDKAKNTERNSRYSPDAQEG